MKRKLLLTILSTATAATLAFGLAACNATDSALRYDDLNHWTLDGKGNPTDVEMHDIGNDEKCAVCGYFLGNYTKGLRYIPCEEELGPNGESISTGYAVVHPLISFFVYGLGGRTDVEKVGVSAWTLDTSNIVIPSFYEGIPVTRIHNFAFMADLDSIITANPDAIIAYEMFELARDNWDTIGMRKIASIKIPSSVTSIGFRAFSDCSGLTSATFENPNGWRCSPMLAELGETMIASSNLSNLATAAKYLTDTYCSQEWKRS